MRTYLRHWSLVAVLITEFITPALTQSSACGTPTPSIPLRVSPEVLRQPGISDPVMLRMFVHVFADNNGTNRAAEDTMILSRLESMQEYYAPRDICFQLIGIRQINNTDLNNHNTSTEESELFPFLVPDAINMFLHTTLINNEGGLNGSAYDIPNSYFSIVGSVIQTGTNLSTTAHEMGHCLGLYHTFETGFGAENVLRAGPCADCSTQGDLLCDTEADPHSDTYDTGNVIDANCNYFGSVTDGCDDIYVMDPHNVMAYGRWECRDYLTPGQGSRMQAIIAITPELQDCIVTANQITLPADLNVTISSGWALHNAIETITAQGNTLTVNGTANAHFTAGKVIVKPKVHFDPGAGGVVQIVAGNMLCD